MRRPCQQVEDSPKHKLSSKVILFIYMLFLVYSLLIVQKSIVIAKIQYYSEIEYVYACQNAYNEKNVVLLFLCTFVLISRFDEYFKGHFSRFDDY